MTDSWIERVGDVEAPKISPPYRVIIGDDRQSEQLANLGAIFLVVSELGTNDDGDSILYARHTVAPGHPRSLPVGMLATMILMIFQSSPSMAAEAITEALHEAGPDFRALLSDTIARHLESQQEGRNDGT